MLAQSSNATVCIQNQCIPAINQSSCHILTCAVDQKLNCAQFCLVAGDIVCQPDQITTGCFLPATGVAFVQGKFVAHGCCINIPGAVAVILERGFGICYRIAVCGHSTGDLYHITRSKGNAAAVKSSIVQRIRNLDQLRTGDQAAVYIDTAGGHRIFGRPVGCVVCQSIYLRGGEPNTVGTAAVITPVIVQSHSNIRGINLGDAAAVDLEAQRLCNHIVPQQGTGRNLQSMGSQSIGCSCIRCDCRVV